MMFKAGDILHYHYLWARQASDGEEAGRKARPVCLVVRTPTEPVNLYLFPLTSQQPVKDQASLAITQIECRRAGLDFPTWLILSEYNFVRADSLVDLASVQPLGSFSAAFLKKIAALIKEIAAKQRLQGVRRG